MENEKDYRIGWKAVNIKWEVDNKKDLEMLPTEIDLPFALDVKDNDKISDYLSDFTGYLHNGFALVQVKWVKVKDARRFVIRARKEGYSITCARTIDRAKEIVAEFEEQDKKENDFEKDFYEIYDKLKNEIVK